MSSGQYVLGSYATSPNLYALEHPPLAYDATKEQAFYDGLAANPLCGALEVQLDDKGAMHCFDEAAFLAEFVPPRWGAVLTCIGGTMANVGASAAFGLASTNVEGRTAALDFAKKAHAAVQRWNARSYDGVDQSTVGKMIAVQIHSAPNNTKPGASSSTEAFTESLIEIMSWDWEGARIVVEHCDAPAPASAPHPASKGFLTIDAEIEAIKAANANADAVLKNGAVGMAINWARSVLETRDVETPLQHLKAAGDAGCLLGLMFSGCTPEEAPTNPYGMWRDCHMPHAPHAGVTTAAKGSLMTVPRIKQAASTAAAAAGDASVLYYGCKITSLHTGLWVGDDKTDDTATRIELNAELLKIIDEALRS